MMWLFTLQEEQKAEWLWCRPFCSLINRQLVTFQPSPLSVLAMQTSESPGQKQTQELSNTPLETQTKHKTKKFQSRDQAVTCWVECIPYHDLTPTLEGGWGGLHKGGAMLQGSFYLSPSLIFFCLYQIKQEWPPGILEFSSWITLVEKKKF